MKKPYKKREIVKPAYLPITLEERDRINAKIQNTKLILDFMKVLVSEYKKKNFDFIKEYRTSIETISPREEIIVDLLWTIDSGMMTFLKIKHLNHLIARYKRQLRADMAGARFYGLEVALMTPPEDVMKWIRWVPMKDRDTKITAILTVYEDKALDEGKEKADQYLVGEAFDMWAHHPWLCIKNFSIFFTILVKYIARQ